MRVVPTGVIGHVDHGKTELVGRLTGTRTDRLPEERERGISIVPGFARLTVADREIHLIDLPGHERFVRAMVSGATGIEAVLLAVDAHEGVKPQTVEHLEIASLIGVRRGVIAVTKCDLTPDDAARRVAAEAAHLAARCGLGMLPMVLTSAVTGRGIGELVVALGDLAVGDRGREDMGFFYLPTDRAFAVPGFGTVVTGTLRRGALACGDAVEVMPSGLRARVRSLQSHGRTVDQASPGARAAVNLRGVGRQDIQRGAVLAAPGCLAASRWLDVRLQILESAGRALENGRTVRLLIGTVEVGARVRLLEGDRTEPGETAMAQLHCDRVVAVPAQEPFIIREPSPPRTIGGGTVLDPVSRRRRRFDGSMHGFLQVLATGRPEEIVARRLALADADGCSADELARLLAAPPGRLDPLLERAGAEAFGGTVLLNSVRTELERAVLDHLAGFHRAHPAEPGLSGERLRRAVAPALPAPAFDGILGDAVARRRLVRDHGVVRRPDLDPLALVADRDRALVAAVEQAFRHGALTPPDLKAVIGQDRRKREAAKILVRLRILVPTVDRVQARQIVFHRDAIQDARRRIERDLADHADGFLVGEVGRLLGITRKFSIPLLEHLDAAGFTRRCGDRRIVVKERGTRRTCGRSEHETA